MCVHTSSFVERAEYLKNWKEMGDDCETTTQITGVQGSTDSVLDRLAAANVSNIAKRVVSGQVSFTTCAHFMDNIPLTQVLHL